MTDTLIFVAPMITCFGAGLIRFGEGGGVMALLKLLGGIALAVLGIFLGIVYYGHVEGSPTGLGVAVITWLVPGMALVIRFGGNLLALIRRIRTRS